MPEKVRRLNPTPQTLRRVFALSRNRCAFPNCSNPAIDDSGSLLAEVCHIEAANESGQRFNVTQTNEERRKFENLILLCRHHHVVTDDVIRYPTEAMQEMKAAHEAKAYVGGARGEELQEKFVDQSLSISLQIPTNFRQLDLSHLDDQFFVEARKLMEAIAKLPNLTRSLYAHALVNSYVGDLYLYCDPFELGLRLGMQPGLLDPHFVILENQGLMWVPEYKDDWRKPAVPGWRSYFRQLDKEDYGIYFLYLMRKRFASEKAVLQDIIENLNFNLLDL